MTSRRRSTLWVFVASHAATDFATGSVAALLPYFVLYQDYDYTAVAGLVLASTAVSGFSQPLFGLLTDRVKARWLIITGMVTAGVALGFSGLIASNYWATFALIAVSGLGVAAFHPEATVAVRESAGTSGKAMSFFSVGGNIGTALAPAGVLATVGVLGLTATPFLALPGLVMAAIGLRRLGRAHTISAPTRHGHDGSQMPQTNDWRSFGILVSMLLLWSVGNIGTNAFVGLYSIEKFASNEVVAAITIAMFPAGAAVGTLTGGVLADRIGRMRVMRIGYAAACVSTLGLIYAPDPISLIIATAIFGAFLCLPFPTHVTLAHSYLPGHLALGSGIVFGFTLATGGLISPALGALADATTLTSVFIIVFVLLGIGAAISWVLRERTPGPGELMATREQ